MKFIEKKEKNNAQNVNAEPEEVFCGVFHIKKLIDELNDEDFKKSLLNIIQDEKLAMDIKSYSLSLMKHLKDNSSSLNKEDRDMALKISTKLFCSDGTPKFKHEILYSHFKNTGFQNNFYENYLLFEDVSLLLDILENVDKLKRLYSGSLSAEEEMFISMNSIVNIKVIAEPLQIIYYHYLEENSLLTKRDLHMEIWRCYNRVSKRCKKISARQGGVKDQNVDFPWKSIEFLSSALSINPVGAMANVAMEKIKDDLDEFEKRIKHIIQQQLFLNPNFNSELLKEYRNLSFPNEFDRMLLKDVSFGSGDVVMGLPNIRQFTEDFMDDGNLHSLEKLFGKLKKFDPSSAQGREAIIVIVQQIGEISSNVSHSTRLLMKDYPFDELKKLRNNLVHSVDRQDLYDKLNNYINDLSIDVVLKVKDEILTLENCVKKHKELLHSKLIDIVALKEEDSEKLWGSFSGVVNASAPFSELLEAEEIERALDVIKRSLPEDERETQETKDKLTSIRGLFQGDLPQPFNRGDIVKIFKDGKKGSKAEELMGISVNVGLFQNCGTRSRAECEGDKKFFKDFLSKLFKYHGLEGKLSEKVGGLNIIKSLIGEFDKNKHKPSKKFFSTSKSEQQLNLVLISIKKISYYTNELDGDPNISIEDIRQKCKSNDQYHQAVLFNLSIIGQAMQKLSNSKDFRQCASAELRKEFVILRSIRNAIMHDHNKIDENRSLIGLYSNDLELTSVVSSGERAFDLSKYLEKLEIDINQTKLAINKFHSTGVGGSEEQELEFLIGNVYDELLEASESKNNHKCAFILEEVLGVEIIDEDWHGEDRFEKQGKWYIPLNVAKEVLDSVGMKMLGGRMSLENFIEDRNKVDDLCKRFEVEITGIYGTLSKYSFETSHKNSGVVVNFKGTKNLERMADFKKQFKALFVVEPDVVTHTGLQNFVDNISEDRKAEFLEKNNIHLDSQGKIIVRAFEETLGGYELCEAVEARNVSKVKEILNREIKPYHDQRVEGYVAFDRAMMDFARGGCVGKSFEIAKMLLQNGSDVNCFDKHGQSALCYAIRNDDIESFKFLVENGADRSILNKSGDVEGDFLEEGSEIDEHLKAQSSWQERMKEATQNSRQK